MIAMSALNATGKKQAETLLSLPRYSGDIVGRLVPHGSYSSRLAAT